MTCTQNPHDDEFPHSLPRNPLIDVVKTAREFSPVDYKKYHQPQAPISQTMGRA